MITFREALILKLKATGKSLKSVAEGAKVSYEQLKKVRQGESKSTNVDDAVKVAAYFGMTLNDFMLGEQATARSEIVALLERLSPESRDLLISVAKGQLAVEDKDHVKFDPKE